MPGRPPLSSPNEPACDVIARIFFCRLAATFLDEGFRHFQRTTCIRAHELIEQVEIQCAKGLIAKFSEDAGIVDQHVDRLIPQAPGQRIDRSDVADVERLDRDPRVFLRQRFEIHRRFGRSGPGDDVPSLRRILFREFEADAPVGARNQHRVFVVVIHAPMTPKTGTDSYRIKGTVYLSPIWELIFTGITSRGDK